MPAFRRTERDSSVTTGGTDFDRDRRALTEAMTVLPEGGDIYTVVGQHGNGEYRVDGREKRCTCADHTYRQIQCKHIRRVDFATGERPVPRWVDPERIDSYLGEHAPGMPRVARPDGGVVLGPDGVDDDGERPADCDCGEWNQGQPLPCWPCYREGFEWPNPNVAEIDA